MSDMWEAPAEVYALMKEILVRDHTAPHRMLHLVDDKIAIVFKEKAGVSAGRVVMGKTKKATPLLNTLGEKGREILFIIELGDDEWQGMPDEDRIKLLDHHLCAMTVIENAKTGTVKYAIAPPDFVGYKDEIERHGVWRYNNREDAEEGYDVINRLFGSEDDDDDA